MHRLPLTIPAIALLLAACSSGGSQSAPPSVGSPTAPLATSGSTTRVEVRLTDGLRIELASDSVPLGVPVTFVVTNTGVLEHEFFLGDEAAQAEHEQEMVAMGGMTHDEANGIAVAPGETKELTFTFTGAGVSIAGCHVVGHYAGGMLAEITVGE